ncbi:MAG: heparinase II/III-family protein, partial [Muribaculaceae bacterium]|nr:heparinase II/III-family protein [Muribaculaceae bacterium]
MSRIIIIFLFAILLSFESYCEAKSIDLIFANDKIERLKKEIKDCKEKGEAYKKISHQADKAMSEAMPYDKLDCLALKFLVENDKKAYSKIIQTITELSKKESLEPADMLHRKPAWRSQLATAIANYNMAVGFNAIYDELSDNMRDSLARCIYKSGIEPTVNDWLDPLTRHHTINSMGHNYWMACIGNCAIACMAVVNELPEVKRWITMADYAVKEWLDFEGDLFQNKPRTIDNGAYYESVNYANYGMSQYLLYKYAKGNFLGNDYELSDTDKLIANYFMNVCYPVSTGKLPSLYFGDGDEYSNGEMCLKLLYEMGVTDDNMLWYLSKVTPHQHKEGLPIDTPLGILITPDLSSAPKLPDLPLETAYKDNGWASLRNSWDDNSTMLGIKCGHTWNHAHADAGSFILYHNGLPVVKDAGNCWYPKPDYREYFFQSEAHNVVMIDGKAQLSEQQYKGSANDGRISDVVSKNGIKFITADASGPTSANFSRNLRSFLWIDNTILI